MTPHTLIYMRQSHTTYSTIAKYDGYTQKRNWPTTALQIVISIRQILF